jgi:hypothetical protein
MHISITVPNPLARLTQILVALDQRRGGVDPQAPDPNKTLDRCVGSREETRADSHDDLESLSLSRCASPPDGNRDALDFLSLSRVERTTPGHRDSLGDLSLTRSFPPRPGP